MEKIFSKTENIPSVIWGTASDKVYIYVHGKLQNKRTAESFAGIAEKKGFQTLSFDLPQHGDRAGESVPCDIWNGIEDLQKIYDYAAKRWKKIALFGCSIGAFFALHAYKNIPLEKCLFLSPIIDMDYLIRQMFIWFDTNEEQLREKGTIPTPVETLSWKYYCYVKENPIEKWSTPAHILFGRKDVMQNEKIMQDFIKQFDGTLTVSQNSEHAFLSPQDNEKIKQWLIDFL